MVWVKLDCSTWIDDCDGAEKVFYSMLQAFKRHNWEHGLVYAICSICPTRSADGGQVGIGEILRWAWIRLCFDFPALTVFEDRGSKIYIEPTAANIKTWVEETFWVDEDAKLACNVVTGLHLRKLLCLIFVAQSSEVLFYCLHRQIDVLSTYIVLDRLFGILVELL